MQSNVERLEVLRGGLKSCFGKLEGYVDAAASCDSGVVQVMAAQTRNYYQYHLGLFRDKADHLSQVSDKFVDGILADWMKSNVLVFDPGIVEDDTPAVHRDVGLLLGRAEEVLAEFDDEDLSGLKPETLKSLQSIAPGAEAHLGRMMLVQDLLRQCVEQDRSGLKPFSSGPSAP